MGVDAIPVKPDWEARLDNDVVLTNDFGIIDAVIAEGQLLGVDHVATFMNLIDKASYDPKPTSAVEVLNAINVETVETAELL